MDYRDERRNYNYDDRDYNYDDRDYRYDYRMDYRNGGRRGGRRMYRTEEDEYMEELSECIKNGICSSKDYEKLAEMTDNRDEKNKLMKMAQREKEHYEAMKEILEKHM